MGALITAENVVKDFGELRAVAGVNFSINEGECFGFLGPNGAGKTTLVRMIYCFMPPTSGVLRVFGQVTTENPSTIKAREGVMPQDDNLDPDLSVFENLVVYARYFDIRLKDSEPRAEALLKFFDLMHRREDRPMKLSGGMRRRLILARALMNEPDLLLLDEPTTGMDPHSRHNVWDNLQRLKYENKTLVLTTHYMEEAEQLCDRVAIMDLGRIVAVNSPQALMEEHGGDLEDVYLKLTGRSLEY